MTVDPSTYSWIEDELEWFAYASCVTVATGATRDELVAAFDTDLSKPVDPTDGEDSIAFAHVGTAQVAIENNGIKGSDTEVLARVSRGGRSACAFWNVDAMVLFGCAEDGEVLYLDEFAFAGTEGMPEPLIALAELAAIDDSDVVPVPDPDGSPEVSNMGVAMALLETWTGVRITPELVTSAVETSYANPL